MEIKSAATFSPDFLKNLERFKSLGAGRVATSAVLYNGDRRFNIRGVEIFNPLLVEDLWGALTSQAGGGTR